MSDVLTQICKDKLEHVLTSRLQRPLIQLEEIAREASAPRGFTCALEAKNKKGEYGLIAEIKKASPSKGLIRKNFNVKELAQSYQSGGAACLSVLTDKPYFQGSDEYLVEARESVNLPVLRKDFMLDPYQIVESRALGADCILLIMAALENTQAQELEALSIELGMDVLIEIHNEKELERALTLKSPLIGINNRNLKTLVVDIATTEALASLVPEDRKLVAESGLKSSKDLARMAKVKAKCFLIGESLMKEDDVKSATINLLRIDYG